MAETPQTRSQIKFDAARSSNKPLWISIALGVVAALANMLYVSKVDGSRLTVLKAKYKITIGKKVNRDDFATISIFGDDLKQMRSLIVEARDMDAFSTMPLAETLEPGQVLMQSSFGFAGNRGIRDSIDTNHRAIALQVKDDVSAVAYLVRPGDVVDVWVGDDAGSVENIIPGAVVRAVGDSTLVASESGGRDFRYRTVTVVIHKDDVKVILSKLGGKNNVTLALAGSSGQ